MAVNLNDFTANGNNLTNHGTTAYTATHPYAGITGAVQLDKSIPQYLSAPTASSLDITADVTIQAWVRIATLPSVAGTNYVVAGKFVSKGYAMYIDHTANEINFISYDAAANNNNYVSSGLGLTANTWTSIAIAVHSANQTAIAYKNGSALTTNTTSATASSIDSDAYDFEIGAGVGGATSNPFDGIITDVRIWNSQISGGTIAANYNVRPTGSESGLVAWYPFDNLTVPSGFFMMM